MKKISFLFLSLSILMGFSVTAQTADEIVAKHIAAIGGKEKLDAVKSIVSDISMNLMGTDAPVKATLVVGVGYKTESDYNGSMFIQSYHQKAGWMVNPMMSGPDPQPMSELMYSAGRDQMFVDGALQNYEARGNKLELNGIKDKSFVINVTNGGAKSTYYIDTTTYLINKVVVNGEMMGQPAEVATTYSDYRKTDAGLLIPYAFETSLGDFVFSSKVQKVEFNKEIDPKIFEMPK